MKYGSFLIALLLMAAMPASADSIYRWVNDDGVTQFTAHPPPDRESARVNIRSGRSVPLETTRETTREATSQSTPTAANSGPAQAQEKYPANEEPCQTARQNLSILETGGRIRVEGADGPRFMGDEERLERLQETRTFIADNC